MKEGKNFKRKPHMKQSDVFICLKPVTNTSLRKKREFIKAFKKEIKEQQSKKYKKKPTDNIVQIRVIFYFKGECPCDIDNLLKCLLDSMQGVMFVNDKQVKSVIADIEEYSFIEGIALKMTQIVKI